MFCLLLMITQLINMRQILSFIQNRWTDPVWSKVFAAGIVGIVSSIGIFVWSLIKRIPFADILDELIEYLTANKIELDYLTLVLICFSILVILIPMIRLKVVSFQLKNIKVPDRLKSNQFDIINFLDGTWLCEYTGKSDSSN